MCSNISLGNSLNRATHGLPSLTCWVAAAVPGWLCWMVCCMWQEAMMVPAAWTLWRGSTLRPTHGRELPLWTYAGEAGTKIQSRTKKWLETQQLCGVYNCQHSFRPKLFLLSVHVYRVSLGSAWTQILSFPSYGSASTAHGFYFAAQWS